MPLKFLLLVNKQGQTRLAKYADHSMTVEEKRALEGEIVRKCLTRAEKQVKLCLSLALAQRLTQFALQVKSHVLQCSFVEHRVYKVIYRRYASLFFLVGVDGDEVRIMAYIWSLPSKTPLNSQICTSAVGRLSTTLRAK